MNKTNMNKTHQTGVKYTCASCRRDYQRKIYYSRHVAVCELMSKTIKERRLENEECADTPSARVMYEIILELTHKISQMEQKIQELSKWTDLKKKKINAVDWLNKTQKENPSLIPSLEEFLSKITVQRNHLEYLFQNDYTSGIVNVLQELLPLEHSDIHAIKAFEQKNNILFAYDGKQWSILSDALFQQLINSVVKHLLDDFVKWQNENSEKMDQDDFALKYSANVKKIMGGGLTRTQVYSKVKLELYKYLKINIKNIIEYQFI